MITDKYSILFIIVAHALIVVHMILYKWILSKTLSCIFYFIYMIWLFKVGGQFYVCMFDTYNMVIRYK